VLALQTGGFAAAAPLAGMVADRLDRRRLMVSVDLARIPVALAFLLATRPETLWIAFVAVLVLAAGAAFFEPTSSAALPNLVEPDELPAANVLIGSAWGTMLAIGAALGGLVAVTLGREAAFVINAVSFAVSAWLIVGIRRPLQLPREPGHAPRPRITDSIKTAVSFARERRTVATFLLTKTSFGIGTGMVALLAVFGRNVFGAGDVGIGILFAARGLGALIGPFAARSLMGTDDRGLIRGIGWSFLVLVVGYTLFPLAPGIWLAAPLVFAAHCGGGAQWTFSTLGLQRATPDEIRGRIFSVDYALVTLMIALSTLLAGFLADAVPPQIAAWAMVTLVALAGAAWFAFSRGAVAETRSVDFAAEDR
ncbi:MAG TPA: MFS transporter, partial [Solirubrobacteraceae bacterium]|nr:MFS transporter [Solirubrobacteraceae bacterium]